MALHGQRQLGGVGQGQLGGLGGGGQQQIDPQLLQLIQQLQRQANQPIARDRFGIGLAAPEQTRGMQAGQGIRGILQALSQLRSKKQQQPTVDPSVGKARAASPAEVEKERASLKKSGRLFEQVAKAAVPKKRTPQGRVQPPANVARAAVPGQAAAPIARGGQVAGGAIGKLLEFLLQRTTGR